MLTGVVEGHESPIRSSEQLRFVYCRGGHVAGLGRQKTRELLDLITRGLDNIQKDIDVFVGHADGMCDAAFSYD